MNEKKIYKNKNFYKHQALRKNFYFYKMSSNKNKKYSNVEDESDNESECSGNSFTYVAEEEPIRHHKELVFFIDFHDGYAFRQIMEFLKLTVTSVPMYFSENGISILQGNGDGSLIVNINIKGPELLTYYFNKDLANMQNTEGPDMPSYHMVCFNVSKFRDTIKSTARKEGIRIFQYKDESLVHIQVYGGNKNGEGGTAIEVQPYTPVHYELSGFEQSTFNPNCRSPLSEFCNSCGHFGKVKSTKYTNFACYPKGIKVTAVSETGAISMFKKWGECENNDSMKIPGGGPRININDTRSKNSHFNVKIPIEFIKALSKLSNLTNNGIMRVCCETDNIIRFIVSISYYAELTIYYRSSENE